MRKIEKAKDPPTPIGILPRWHANIEARYPEEISIGFIWADVLSCLRHSLNTEHIELPNGHTAVAKFDLSAKDESVALNNAQAMVRAAMRGYIFGGVEFVATSIETVDMPATASELALSHAAATILLFPVAE